MPVNGQDVKFNYYTRAKFNALSSKDNNVIYYVEEPDGKIKQYIGNTPVVSDITKAEIEAKLTGSITSHTHNYRPAGNVPWTEVSGKPSFAPSNAQKNSDITKAEIEAKLTGSITSHTHSTVTTSVAGFMSAADKTKLDGIAAGAQKNRVISTTAQAQAGTNDTTVMTPKKVKEAISASGGGGGGSYELTKSKIDTALEGTGTDLGSIKLGTSASTTGGYATALGTSASATTSSTAIGHGTSTAGSYSTAIGTVSKALVGGSTALGGGASATAGYSIAIGYDSIASGTASTALGYSASTGTSANLMRLGNDRLSTLQSNVQLTVTSDFRDKADIEEVPKALDFIKDLNPITYVSNDRDHYISEEQKETETYKDYLMVEDYDRESHSQGTKKGERRRVGLSAQEVRDKLIEHYGSDNYANVVNDNFVEFEERGLDVPEGLENKLTMSYETMVPFLIKAIQEQQEQIEELKKKLNND